MASVNKNIECDGQRLYDDMADIINIATEYNKEINVFFNRMDFSDFRNEVWRGKNAQLYTSKVMNQKPDYIYFGENLKNLAKEVQEFALSLDDTIVQNEESCEHDQDDDVSSYI